MNQIPISEFPLRWRWTEEKYDKLPKEHLSRIAPLDAAGANILWERSLRFSDYGTAFQPSPKLYSTLNVLEAPHSACDTEGWIRSKFGFDDLSSIKVWVCWQPGLAVQTDMEIFARYWDSFCYKASDDTSVFPETEGWVIHFWHEDRLYYAAISEQLNCGDR